MWFSSGSGRIELQMTLDQARGASHQGQCDSDVRELSKVPAIARQLSKIDPALLREELSEYGAWDGEELADHDQNLQRLLWLAAGDIIDEYHSKQSEKRMTPRQREKSDSWARK
jgi:hypothetical protein